MNDQPRNDRLSLRKTNEEVLRKKLQLEAQAKCKDETIAFGECAKRTGMLVVLRCRQENAISKYIILPLSHVITRLSSLICACLLRVVSACMDRHATEKDFENLLIREGIDPACLQRTHKP
jgi:hypothetical protein